MWEENRLKIESGSNKGDSFTQSDQISLKLIDPGSCHPKLTKALPAKFFTFFSQLACALP
jgi:hypothetical protein